MPDENLVIDFRKVKEGGLYHSFTKNLFREVHDNSPEEEKAFNKDITRDGIVVDVNGTRKIYKSKKEFMEDKNLNEAQKQYITNICHQGIFGGGAAVMPMARVGENEYMPMEKKLASDIFISVYIRDDKVTLIHSKEFQIQDVRTGFALDTMRTLQLSMVADVTNIHEHKGNKRDIPIYMVANEFGDVGSRSPLVSKTEAKESDAVISQNEISDKLHFITQARRDRALDREKDLDSIVKDSLDNTQSLADRQTKLDIETDNKHFVDIPDKVSDGTQQILASQICYHTTSDADRIFRLHYGAKKVAEYAASFDDNKNDKPHSKVVSEILSNLTDDPVQQSLFKKNAPMILRQAVETKNLSFTDRVKKVFDRVGMIVIPEKRELRDIMRTVKISKKSEQVERLSENRSKLRTKGSYRQL